MADVVARLDKLAEESQQRVASLMRARDRIAEIEVTGTSADHVVAVTVCSTGAVTDVHMDDRVSRLRPGEVAARVIEAVSAAQRRIPSAVEGVLTDSFPGEPDAVERMVSGYTQRFAAEPTAEVTGTVQPPVEPPETGGDGTTFLQRATAGR